MHPWLRTVSTIAFCFVVFPSMLDAQETKAKPKYRRAKPPAFDEKSMSGVFFDDVKSQLVGSLPSANASMAASSVKTETSAADASVSEADNIWKKRIDTATVEDLIKSAKLRLDPAVTSPAKFASGGYQIARRDFTLLTVLFGVIEQYPGDVRWKHSAARAKADFARIAENAKVGSLPAYNEAKAKHQTFGDLLNGVRLDPPKDALTAWSDTVDRIAAMQLLEWILRDSLNATVASDGAFRDGAEEARKYAQLTSVIGEILLQDGMPDQDSEEYQQWTKEMIASCEQIVVGATKPDLTTTREAISRLDKSCNSCHEHFR